MEAWYPGLTAHQAMKSVYAGVLERLRNGEKPAAIEAEQLDLVRTAYAVYAKAEELLKAQHAMSAELAKLMASDAFKLATPEVQHKMQAKFLREQAPAQHQDLAHNKQGGLSLPQLMQAAAAMDINPSQVYANVLFYKTELDCAMLLGRLERGVGVMLGPKHIKRLNRFMAQADAAGDDPGVDEEAEVAQCLRDQALRVKTRGGWEEFFAIAEPHDQEFWITKTV
jgi:hypothetical protein